MIFKSMRSRFLALVLCLVLTMSLSMGIALANDNGQQTQSNTEVTVNNEGDLLSALGNLQYTKIIFADNITTTQGFTARNVQLDFANGQYKWTVSAAGEVTVKVDDSAFFLNSQIEIDPNATGLTVVYLMTYQFGENVSGNLESVSYKEGGTDAVPSGTTITVQNNAVTMYVASNSTKKAPKTVEKMKVAGATYRVEENYNKQFFKEYTISYVFSETQDGQTISGPISGVTNGNPTYYTEKTAAFYLKDPVKSGYKFVGWVDGGTIKQSSEILVQPTDKADKTYTAIFYKTSGDGQKGGMNIDASALLKAVEEEETEEEEEETTEQKHVHISMASSGVSSKIKGVTDSMNLNDLLGYQGGESDSSSSVPLIIIGSVLIASALVGIILLIKKK